MTAPLTPVQRIQQLYDAFGRGDVASLLAGLAEDVRWEQPTFPNPIPWLQPIDGRAGVMRFFEALQQVEFTQFEPKHFLAEGNLVVVVVDERYIVKATGKTVVEPDLIHLWRLDEAGLVTQLRHRGDTWQMVQALS